MKLTILALFGLLCINAEKVTYKNFKVYNVAPQTVEQVDFLNELRNADEGYDFWTEIINAGSKVRLMVHPDIESEFVSDCKNVGLQPEIGISNLQEFIEETMKPTMTKTTTRNVGSLTWDRYYNYDQISAWLDELQELYPDVVTIVIAGNSNEGRPIKGVKIDLMPNDRGNTSMTGMIEGGIHAREWISPATVTWIIKEFLTSDDPGIKQMAEHFVWHIFPVVNPDGYTYSFTDNRLWRKNRNPNYFTNCTFNNDISNGIDLNRNFDFLWMSTGASSNPCSETYAGPSAASEPETRAISNYVLTLREHTNLLYYFAFHSYSQLILIPYSHVVGADKLEAYNYADLYEIAIRGAEKLTEVHGTPYTVGVSAEILYAVSGSSFDWAKGAADVPIALLFELRDIWEYGFLLPADQIIPNSEEIMASLVEIDRVTGAMGYYASSANMALTSFVLILSSVVVLLV